MFDITRQYVEDEIKTTKNSLKETCNRRKEYEKDTLKRKELLKIFYDKCKARKVMMASSSTALASVVAAFIAGLLVPASVLTIAITGPCIIVVSASTVVFLNSFDKYKFKKSQLKEDKSYVFAPCDFDILPNGELCAELIIKRNEEQLIIYDCTIEKHKGYIKELQKICDKLDEDEEIGKEEESKTSKMKEYLETEWNDYLEEISKVSPSEVHYQDSLEPTKPVKLKKSS